VNSLGLKGLSAQQSKNLRRALLKIMNNLDVKHGDRGPRRRAHGDSAED
jgi:hypothetical protein